MEIFILVQLPMVHLYSGVHVEAIDSNQLVFSWNPVPFQCPYIQYIINSTNCGLCPNITNDTSVLCVHYSVDAHKNRTCIFVVQTELCDAILGDRNNSIAVNLVGEYYIN